MNLTTAIQYLNNRHITVAMAHLPPWAIYSSRYRRELSSGNAHDQDSNKTFVDGGHNNVTGWSGGSFDLLLLFQKITNFTFSIRHQPQDAFGRFNATTGRWHGMLGLIYNGEADVLFQGIQATDDRRRDFALSTQYYTRDPYVIVYRQTHETGKNASVLDWFKVARPFDSGTWMMCVLAMLIVIVLSTAMETLMTHNLPSNTSRRQLIWARLYGNLLESFEEVVRHLTSRGAELRCRSFAAKFLIIVWALFCVILMSLYPAQLFSILSLPEVQREPFYDFASMKARGYTLATRKSAAYASLLHHAYNVSLAKDGKLSDIVEPMEEWPGTYEDVKRMLDNNKTVALLATQRDYKMRETGKCRHRVYIIDLQDDETNRLNFRELSLHFPYSSAANLVFRKNNTILRDAFDQLLVWAQKNGLLIQIERKNIKWQRQHQLNMQKNSTASGGECFMGPIGQSVTDREIIDEYDEDGMPITKEKKTAFGWYHMLSAFACMGIGIALGIAACCAEQALYSHNRKKRDNPGPKIVVMPGSQRAGKILHVNVRSNPSAQVHVAWT